MRCNYCGCESSEPFLFTLSLLILGKRYVTCRECGMTSSYILIYHRVHDTMDKLEKEYNKKYNDEHRRLWRKG